MQYPTTPSTSPPAQTSELLSLAKHVSIWQVYGNLKADIPTHKPYGGVIASTGAVLLTSESAQEGFQDLHTARRGG